MNDVCVTSEQLSNHVNDGEQYSAKDYLDALLLDDEAEVVIENESVTIDNIVTKYLDSSELEELAVMAINKDYEAVRNVFITAIEELMQ